MEQPGHTEHSEQSEHTEQPEHTEHSEHPEHMEHPEHTEHMEHTEQPEHTEHMKLAAPNTVLIVPAQIEIKVYIFSLYILAKELNPPFGEKILTTIDDGMPSDISSALLLMVY